MKKSIVLLLSALMMLAAASACAKTITPMPVRVNPDAVANQAVYVRLLDINWRAGTVTVALCEPEVFACEDAMALQPGDVLLTGGEKMQISSVMQELPAILINADEDAFSLFENADGNFESKLYDRRIMTVVGERPFELSDDLIFLDGIDPSTGEALTLPTAHTLRALKNLLSGSAYDPGFAADNAYMVFDDEQEVVVLARFYVPWQ